MNGATLYKEEWVSLPEEWSEATGDDAPASPGMPNPTEGASRSISRLRRLYEFRGDLVVERFLQNNSTLVRLLLDAYEEIHEHFDLGVRTALEVVADPEARGDEQLFIVIRTKFPPKVARALLAELDQDWWLDTLPEAGGKMEIVLERLKRRSH